MKTSASVWPAALVGAAKKRHLEFVEGAFWVFVAAGGGTNHIVSPAFEDGADADRWREEVLAAAQEAAGAV